MDPKFDGLMRSAKYPEEIHRILSFLQEAKEAGSILKTINFIEFESPTKAYVNFNDSAHGGEYVLEKIDGEWHVVESHYAL